MALIHSKPTTTTIGKDEPVYYYVKRDGTRFPVSITVTPIVLNKKTIGAIEVFRDITREIEANRAKTEFLSIASHELRAPLGIIKAFISMILEGDFGVIDTKLQSPLADISTSTERLIQLVNDMLNVSRIEAGRMLFKLTEFPIKTITDNVVLDFAMLVKKGEVAIEAGNPPAGEVNLQVQGDQDKVREILNNLVGNAVKFTERGSITIFSKQEGEFLNVYIKDTGIGIPEEDQKKIFGKFQQASSVERGKPKGTGLGLYICSLLAQKMGGRTWLVSSRVGVGSVFAFSLPLAGTAVALKAKKTVEEEAKLNPEQKSFDSNSNKI